MSCATRRSPRTPAGLANDGDDQRREATRAAATDSAGDGGVAPTRCSSPCSGSRGLCWVPSSHSTLRLGPEPIGQKRSANCPAHDYVSAAGNCPSTAAPMGVGCRSRCDSCRRRTLPLAVPWLVCTSTRCTHPLGCRRTRQYRTGYRCPARPESQHVSGPSEP